MIRGTPLKIQKGAVNKSYVMVLRYVRRISNQSENCMNNGSRKPDCVFQRTVCKFELTNAAREALIAVTV